MTVSVALAAYNGEKYIGEQLSSILPQLSEDDEIVVSVDPSSDSTRDIVSSLSETDSRVKLIDGGGRGLIKNFENAIKNCKNDIIFPCDQDDIWLPQKVSRVKAEFKNNSDLLLTMHDAKIVDENLREIESSFFAHRGTKTGIIKNLWKNSYMGCCMAFRKEMLGFILPFPENLPMHDQWIGLVCEKRGKVSLIREPLMLYRRHGNNASKMQHESVVQMIKWRLNIIFSLIRNQAVKYE
jgi:glycosyltransferase involved in cell wall biosynthesis